MQAFLLQAMCPIRCSMFVSAMDPLFAMQRIVSSHNAHCYRFCCVRAASLHSFASIPDSCSRLFTPSLMRIWQ